MSSIFLLAITAALENGGRVHGESVIWVSSDLERQQPARYLDLWALVIYVHMYSAWAACLLTCL